MIENISGIARLGLSMPAYFAETLIRYRYARRVLMVLPWREIFRQDAERQHSYAEAEREFDASQQVYRANGYEVVLVPKLPLQERADFIEHELSLKS